MTPSEPRVPLFKPFSHFTGRRVFLGPIAFSGPTSSSETMVPLDTASPRELVGVPRALYPSLRLSLPWGPTGFSGPLSPCDTGS